MVNDILIGFDFGIHPAFVVGRLTSSGQIEILDEYDFFKTEAELTMKIPGDVYEI